MNDLSQLSQDERLFIVSIPYRVGIWISTADDNEKSKLDDRKEEQALGKAISHMAKLHRRMPFAVQIMTEIQTQKDQWESWKSNSGEAVVLEDVKKANALLKDRGADHALKQYKHAIWQTALTVAQAYGEHIDPDNELHFDRLMAWIGSFIFAPRMAKSPENMSAKEKTALKKLRAILKN